MKLTKEQYREKYYQKLPEISQLDPVVMVTLDRKDYKLEFTNQSAMDVLSDCGFNIISDRFTPQIATNAKVLGSLLYRGLEKHQPDLDQMTVNHMYSIRQYHYVSNCIIEALTSFLPDMSEYEVHEPEVEEETEKADPIVTG